MSKRLYANGNNVRKGANKSGNENYHIFTSQVRRRLGGHGWSRMISITREVRYNEKFDNTMMMMMMMMMIMMMRIMMIMMMMMMMMIMMVVILNKQ